MFALMTGESQLCIETCFANITNIEKCYKRTRTNFTDIWINSTPSFSAFNSKYQQVSYDVESFQDSANKKCYKNSSKRHHIDIMCIDPTSDGRRIDAHDVNMMSF